MSFPSEAQYGQYVPEAFFHLCSKKSFEILKTLLEKSWRSGAAVQDKCPEKGR